MHKLLILLITILIQCSLLQAQDTEYAKKQIDTLSSPAMHGRGYVNNGINFAADYLKSELQSLKLSPLGQDFFQPFHIPINTFPGKIELSINGQELKPAVDYMIASNSPSISGNFKIDSIPVEFFDDSVQLVNFCKKDHAGKFIMINRMAAGKKHRKLIDSIASKNECKAKGYILIKKNIYWHVSKAHTVKDHVQIDLLAESWPEEAEMMSINVKTRFNKNFPVKNVVGYVPGKKYWSNFVVITAHYDHLGRMGNSIYFPGANDNGSGTAMALDLARYYAQPENKPDYSTVFIFFASEEAGLLGSKYFTDHPLVPLKRIRFMINLDMVGTGGDGITVVNGKVEKEEFNMLTSINDTAKYLPEIKARGEAANSDHYHFYKNEVPAIFIYTRGDDYREYHNIYDKPGKLPLTGYEGLFRLLTDFIEQL
ncbi:MAG: M28 family peptidase [Bacteroidales bacterium]|nr:M28 family peptidase [Bacteroidales bacterium]